MTATDHATASAITLTIAGSETTGGAGARADLKTFQQLGVYGITALTCIVSFNPRDNWDHRFVPIEPHVIADQLEAIQPCYSGSLETVKLGMLGSPATIDTVAAALGTQKWRHVVLDPVLICKGQEPGHALDTDQALKIDLLPLATFVTPNHFEAESLSGIAIEDVQDLERAARIIHEASGAVVLAKGGVRVPGPDAVDVYYDGERAEVLSAPGSAHRQGVRHGGHREPRPLDRAVRRPLAGRPPLDARPALRPEPGPGRPGPRVAIA